MKADALFQFVKSLSEDELRRFYGLLCAESKGEELIELVRILNEFEQFGKAKLRKAMKIGPSRLDSLLENIDSPSYNLFANQNAESKLFNALIAANKLVFRMADQAAIDVMEWAFEEAARVERFDISLELIELSTILTTPHEFETASKGTLIRKQINYLAYQEIEEQFRMVLKPDCDPEWKANELKVISNSDLITSRNRATSTRALAIYLKVKAVHCLILDQHDEAIALQSEFVELLKQNGWLNIENDFFLIKESSQLSTFLKVNGRAKEAYNLIFALGQREFLEPKLELEKERQLYPFRVAVAILSGDHEIAETAIQATLEMVKRRKGTAKPQFITQNLYYCAYAYIAFQEFQKAGRIFNMLSEYKENRRNYSDQLLPMVKILKMVNLASMDEMVNIPNMIHRFRNNSKIETTAYSKLILGLLYRLSNSGTGDWKLILQKYQTKTVELKRADPTVPQFHYFDLEHWLESLLHGGSMAEYIHRRNSMSTDNSSQQNIA